MMFQMALINQIHFLGGIFHLSIFTSTFLSMLNRINYLILSSMLPYRIEYHIGESECGRAFKIIYAKSSGWMDMFVWTFFSLVRLAYLKTLTIVQLRSKFHM